MLDAKFFITLIGLILAILAICNKSTASSVENFWMNPGRTIKSEVMAGARAGAAASASQRGASSGNLRSVGDNYGVLFGAQGMKKGDLFQIPGTWQSTLSPRFANTDFGANIRYNMPSQQNMAAPSNPLTFSNMVSQSYPKEGYNGGPAECGKSGMSIGRDRMPALSANLPQSGYTYGNYSDVMQTLPAEAVTADMLPLGDMTTVNASGDVSQPVIYDRLIYANQKSRLAALGDPIRGDLPIVPCAPEWFRPSVHPHIDLREGAMAVMGGIDNSTARSLYKLQRAATDGITVNQTGGIFNTDMSAQKQVSIGGLTRDENVTSFP